MKRYIIVSTLVHLLCFYAISLRVKQENSTNAQAEQTTVTLVEEKSDARDSGAGRDVEVIEMNPAGQGEKREIKDFYWGIGISGFYTTLPTGIRAYEISIVFGGYTADSAGILPGDLIYSVNGTDLANNDISGDGPMHLVLGIIRGSRFLTLNLDRTKIYY